MAKGLDNSELIDRYLRDEIKGEELEIFRRRLDNDPEFKLEFDTQKLLAEGIRLARKAELKRFIAEKTIKQASVLRTGRIYWLSAAASVAAIALTFFSIRYYNQTSQNANQLAKQKTQNSELPAELKKTEPKQPQPGEIQSDRTLAYENRVAPIPEQVTTIDNVMPLEEDLRGVDLESELNIGTSSAPSQRDINDPTPPQSENRTIAVVTLAVADLNPEFQELNDEQTVTVSSRTRAQTGKVKKIEPAVQESEKESLRSNNSAPAKADLSRKDQLQYQVSFMQNAGGINQVLVKNNTITVCNIPFNNPLLIAYQGKNYLGSGGSFYPINLGLNEIQVVVPVKDKALIQALGGQ